MKVVDLLFTGECMPCPRHSWKYARMTAAVGRRALGVQVAQLNAVIDWMRSEHPAEPLRVITKGRVTGLAALVLAALKPQRIVAAVKPRAGNGDALIAQHVYNTMLGQRLADMKGLQVWRDTAVPRCVMGTAIIRRQISMRGSPILLPQDSKRRPGEKLSLRHLECSWTRVMPYEILRDPATRDYDPDKNETIFGQEKPRTLQWIKRHFGQSVTTEATYGRLIQWQDEMLKATGWTDRYAAHASESKMPAVIVYEFCFQDADIEDSWPWQLFAYLDPTQDAGDRSLKPLAFGRSPFCNLPFHFLYYSKNVHGPWATGLPGLLKSVQDVTNVAASTKLRVMIDHAGPKWLYQVGTVEDPSTQFSNRVDLPIAWRKQQQMDAEPKRIAAPGANPITDDFLVTMKGMAREQANLADVQFGQMVKRGQSGQAYQAVAEQADAVLADMRKDDEIVLNDLLYCTLVDTVKLLKPRRDVVRKMLRDEHPREQVDRAMRGDVRDLVQEVRVVPDSLRPKTPRQVRDDFQSAAEKQIIPAPAAVWEMQRQAGVTLDTTMARAKAKQETEIEMLLAGQEAEVTAGEDHGTSLRVLNEFMSSPRWLSLKEQQQDGIEEHWGMHMNAQQELIAFEAQPPGAIQGAPAGRASAPADRAGMTPSAPAEAATAVA